MSRRDCISNRNIKIIASYVENRLGVCEHLFDGLPCPQGEYSSPEQFFLNEDEWTSYDNLLRVFRKARALVNEPNFYYRCGASTASLASWGRFNYLVRVFASPHDGFRKLPVLNKNFNDTKDIEILKPPTYDPITRKFRTVLKVQNHKDIDSNEDYIRDPYLRGILSAIPTIWGLPPAVVEQKLYPYDPEILFNKEPEFTPYALDVRIEGNSMKLNEPSARRRVVAGEKILLEPQDLDGKRVFLGNYSPLDTSPQCRHDGLHEAILITKTIRTPDCILMKKGDIYMAPYAVIDISYGRLSPLQRLRQLVPFRDVHRDSGSELLETIDQLRKSIHAKNSAYESLERTNTQLRDAKQRLDRYAQELEQKVEERTEKLRCAQQELLVLNKGLEDKVNKQITELERYHELRRYLSPKLTEKILSGEHSFGVTSQRRTMTVMFTDIRDFSSLTDSLEPEEIIHLLDMYLSEMVPIVHRFDGTLNKIIGDGLLIFFGDPIPMKDHAERAVHTAVAMQQKVEELRGEWGRYGHDLAIGIGINTGFMTVGNIGPDVHRDYTVIGNQVNIASRLESCAGPGQILISQRTYSRVKTAAAAEEIGEIKVKGVHEKIRTYKVRWREGT